MINILVVGGYDKETEADSEEVQKFARLLGAEVVKQGHSLLDGCRTDFDRDVAEGTADQAGAANVKDRLTCYVPKGTQPVYDFGTQLISQLEDWDPANGIDTVPELIDEADVVIFIRGYRGINQAAIWADLALKPMLPIASFGGAAERLYHRELRVFDQKYAGRLPKESFKVLNSLPGDDLQGLAATVISAAEQILVSKTVAVMMSYTLDETTRSNLENTYRNACKEFDYEVQQVTELTADEGIVTEIHEKIRTSAFVLADLTDLKPNVFYEFGFAQGIGKRKIVTAQMGTELPFDVKDVPTIFWEANWADLQQKLVEKIRPIATTHGR